MKEVASKFDYPPLYSSYNRLCSVIDFQFTENIVNVKFNSSLSNKIFSCFDAPFEILTV